MNSIIDKKETFQTNSAVYNINSRNKRHLQRPVPNLPSLQKSICYASIKIFNSLSCKLTSLKNGKVQFKSALRKYFSIYTPLFC